MIEAHPEGKFLIHCGFGHINEAEVPGWERALAGRLKEFTGIDPFTINQEILTEHYSKEKENPYFLLADTLAQPSIFIKKDSSLFKGPEGDERFDVRLFHPRSSYNNGRPNWMRMNGERYSYMISEEEIEIDYPVIAKAYLVGEADNAVPLDVIEIKESSDQSFGPSLRTGFL